MSPFPSQPNLNMPAFAPRRPVLPSPAEQMRVPGQPSMPAAPPMLPQGATPAVPATPGVNPATPAVPPQMPQQTPAAFGGGNPFGSYQPGTLQGPANANAILAALMAAGIGNGHIPQNVGPPVGFGGGQQNRPIGVGRLATAGPQVGVGRGY